MTVYAVSRNSAVWKNHPTLERAMEHAAQVAASSAKQDWYQGFNDEGKSAVVSRPAVVRVERLTWVGQPRDGRWVTESIVAEWIAGERTTIV